MRMRNPLPPGEIINELGLEQCLSR